MLSIYVIKISILWFVFSVKMTTMYDKLITFIEQELETRGWSHRELARRADVSQTAVSSTLAGQRRPGADFCIKIAKALSEPPEKLLRLAEHLPPLSASEDNPLVKEILDTVRNMSPDKLQESLNYIRYLYQLQEEEINVGKAARAATQSGIPSTTSKATHQLGKQFGTEIAELLSDLSEDRHDAIRKFIQEQINLQKQGAPPEGGESDVDALGES
jgi:transcriptional regulator with XRE-family HTH domain